MVLVPPPREVTPPVLPSVELIVLASTFDCFDLSSSLLEQAKNITTVSMSEPEFQEDGVMCVPFRRI